LLRLGPDRWHGPDPVWGEGEAWGAVADPDPDPDPARGEGEGS
jgi:hypothetical protein